jgi:lipopolysaccharide/colanic/teichoic acid biosynthesis glycosyltransferase
MYPLLKRVFDLICAIGGMIALFPLFFFLSLAIKIDSRGPVFYRGERVGRFGKHFKILKFRTMQPNAEVMGTTTTLNDPRITRVGGFLRKCKLDELPQLINVIRGEMSIVGPRPEVEEHTNEYNEEEKTILDVVPGITDYSSIHFVSLDQVLGSENPHEVYVTKIRSQKNRLRIDYIEKQSFMEDMKIILKTLFVILKKVTGKMD